VSSRAAELVDELARELDVDREDLAVAIDRVRTSTNPRRRAYAAIGTIEQTTLQGPAAADVLQDRSELVADGGEP
jgi:hypothetical protein